jgi:serine phosphatase RsbU (regulator of sigma subunit)/anti-sigma regulatory factor (Ser/Thr protein kinase)
MFRQSVKEINAEYPAEDKYLDSIRRTVQESCASAGMPRKDIAATILAVEEGATNIIRHAYLYTKGVLRIRIIIYNRLVVISLIDFGRSFDPGGSVRLDLQKLVDSGRRGGLGFYMIRKIMDSVEYISSGEQNELRMVKRLAAPQSGSLPLLRRFSSLRAKFSLFTFLVVLLVVGGSNYYFDRKTSFGAHRSFSEKMRALTLTIADQANGYFLNRRSDVEFDELIVSYVRANPEFQRIVLTDLEGMIVAHSDDIRNIRKPYIAPPEFDTTLQDYPQSLGNPKLWVRYITEPIRSGQRIAGYVHTTYSTKSVHKQIWEARIGVFGLTVVLLIIGIVGIYLLSNYFVSPIARIVSRIRRYTQGDIDTEMPLEGAEEFFEISRAFNEMMTRLSLDRKNLIAREKLAKEIEVASQIQKALLPAQLPDIQGLEIDGFYRAASTVGGDLYDVEQIGDDTYCLTVADVSGKGVPASLVMSMLRTTIQIVSKGSMSPKATLVRVEGYLRNNIPRGMFITVQMAFYSVSARTITVVSAGHNPLMYYRASTGEILNINPSGMPLGIPSTNDSQFAERLEEYTFPLYDGDAIALYTDGITEAPDREGQQFGVERLANILKNGSIAGHGTVADLTRLIVDSVDAFAGAGHNSDDLTLIVARALSPVNQKSTAPLSAENDRELT